MLDRGTRPTPEFEPLDWEAARVDGLLVRIREAGIVGMGGAGFSTAAKLEAGRFYGIQHVIGNGVECEPGVSADKQLLAEHSADVVVGLRIVGRVLDCDDLCLAISDKALQTAVEVAPKNGVSCEVLPSHPANGEERTLIKTLFDSTIPQAEYPTLHGFLVLNVATLFAICEAVRDGRKPSDRLVTTDQETKWVKLGTTVDSLLPHLSRKRIGSQALGYPAHADTAVTLTTNAVAQDIAQSAKACIRCGRCDAACPRELAVEAMFRSLTTNEFLPNLDSHFRSCFECGACVVACPSKIPLLDWIRSGKQKIDVSQRKHEASVRFERRQERLAKTNRLDASARETRLNSSRKW